ncbi:subtilisin-like protein [Lyophyllum atratum]|nr:subtilisin-like protein [Lyophyllum atratum]
MFRALILLGALLIPLSNANPLLNHPTRSGHIIHEKRTPDPSHPIRRLPASSPLPLRIALKQASLDLLPSLLLAVSDPASPSYGQHWTPDQVVRKFAPPDEAAHRVRRWLEAKGVQPERVRRSKNKAWLEVRGATVGEVEELLDARYHVYRREGEGGEEYEHVACDSYSLPRSISEVVDFITPTVQPNIKLGDIGTHRERSLAARRYSKRAPEATDAPTGCDKVVTPDCIKALYNMTYVPKATDRNTFGIVSYYANTYLQSDLDAFFRNFSPMLVGKSPHLISIDGGKSTQARQDQNTDVGETGYILQYAMSLVQPQPVQLLQVGNQQTVRSFNEWLDAVDGSYCTSDGGDDFTYDPVLPDPLPGGLKEHTCGSVKAPYVISNSQALFEHAFPQFYLQRQCNEFAKLGLMGVTVVYSAGNAGTSGATNGYCLDENGSMNANATLFNPSWPASCPWVTAVGGTQVKAGSVAAPGAEEVWNEEVIPGFFESGGGGFSNRFPIPWYQKQAVNAYVDRLRKDDPGHLRLFNTKGRAYPDLSVVANQFLNVDDGSVIASSGTSGAVPTVASIITLVNDARLAAGKTPVGFINPVIYSPGFASAFNDVTSGTNQGCRGREYDKGWDPASGVGTPNLGLLIKKWLALP